MDERPDDSGSLDIGGGSTPMLDAASLSTADLEDRLGRLAARIAAAECESLTLLAEFDARQGWGQCGMRSAAHWLSWRTGTRLGVARERVRVARSLRHLRPEAGAEHRAAHALPPPGLLMVHARDGRPLDLGRRRRHASANPDAPRLAADDTVGHPAPDAGSDTIAPTWGGDPLDLDHLVGGMAGNLLLRAGHRLTDIPYPALDPALRGRRSLARAGASPALAGDARRLRGSPRCASRPGT